MVLALQRVDLFVEFGLDLGRLELQLLERPEDQSEEVPVLGLG